MKSFHSSETERLTCAPARGSKRISHVIFDMDGTLSWLRHGWPRLMVDLFFPYFPATPTESEQAIRDLLMSELLALNGKQTIFQMIRFHEQVTQRGGRCPKPEELLHTYQSALDALIEERVSMLRKGQTQPDEFVIFGARALLEQLRQRDLTLIILSGTIEHRVKEEAHLLGLAQYFGPHIYGGTPDPAHFSKKMVIDRLLREEAISGECLLSFGDGSVEILETKRVGGTAIGVASDEEHNGSGLADPWKRHALLQAGADAVIADYREPERLLKTLFR